MSLYAKVRVTRNGFALDVDMNAESGKTVAILGPNGAGKTTLLRALAGLITFDGRVELEGRVLDDSASHEHVPTEQRRVGLVFQDQVLFPHLTVLDNIAFGLRAKDGTRTARSWLDGAGLGAYANALPRELSGGQAQRVALLRTLATKPELLLLDEPLSSLDVTIRAETRRELSRQLAAFRGVRLLVTHDPIEAMALADHIVVLENGKTVQSGKPEDVAAQPRSKFVADLAGVNLLRGHANQDRIELPGGAQLSTPDKHEGDVFAVIRPRSISLHLAKPEGTPRNVWRGKAEDIDLVGERARVRIKGPVSLVAEVTRAAVKELHLAPGTELWMAVKATEVEVFPA